MFVGGKKSSPKDDDSKDENDPLNMGVYKIRSDKKLTKLSKRRWGVPIKDKMRVARLR